jgi:hypothetical protein
MPLKREILFHIIGIHRHRIGFYRKWQGLFPEGRFPPGTSGVSLFVACAAGSGLVTGSAGDGFFGGFVVSSASGGFFSGFVIRSASRRFVSCAAGRAVLPV